MRHMQLCHHMQFWKMYGAAEKKTMIQKTGRDMDSK